MPFSNTIETCYEQIIANIDQLNLAAGKGEVHVQHNERGNGASFKVNLYLRILFSLRIIYILYKIIYNDSWTWNFLEYFFFFFFQYVAEIYKNIKRYSRYLYNFLRIAKQISTLFDVTRTDEIWLRDRFSFPSFYKTLIDTLYISNRFSSIFCFECIVT